MTSLLAILALGFMLGVRHATDPDHVIAVTTIVSGQRSVRRAALIGAAWGVGHTLTILLVGGGIILFKWAIPARVGLAMELAVAVMLIVLGVASLTGTVRWLRRTARAPAGHVHSHPHVHGDYVHTHPHGHVPESHPHRDEETPLARIDRHLGRIGSYRLARPLIVGVVHGLAGSAAVVLLVLAAITTPLWSVAYLVIFGIGTITGMMIITAAISLPFALGGAGQFLRLQRGLRVASGLISLGFGLVVAYRIGIVDGLFAGEAHWTPR